MKLKSKTQLVVRVEIIQRGHESKTITLDETDSKYVRDTIKSMFRDEHKFNAIKRDKEVKNTLSIQCFNAEGSKKTNFCTFTVHNVSVSDAYDMIINNVKNGFVQKLEETIVDLGYGKYARTNWMLDDVIKSFEKRGMNDGSNNDLIKELAIQKMEYGRLCLATQKANYKSCGFTEKLNHDLEEQIRNLGGEPQKFPILE